MFCPECGSEWCAKAGGSFCLVTGRQRKAPDAPPKDRMLRMPAVKKG